MTEFSISFLGYRKDEVDLAIKNLEEAIQRMQQEIKGLNLENNRIKMENNDLNTLIDVQKELLKCKKL